MSERIPRKRIGDKMAGAVAVKDDLAFVETKCSHKAREIATVSVNIGFKMFFDKHGLDQMHTRKIDSSAVETLVKDILDHLLFYCSRIRGFSFLNHGNAINNRIRIVIQDNSAGVMLNVPVEIHFIDFKTYELTIKTAMEEDNFWIAEGQFMLELTGDDESTLKMKDHGQIKVVDTYP